VHCKAVYILTHRRVIIRYRIIPIYMRKIPIYEKQLIVISAIDVAFLIDKARDRIDSVKETPNTRQEKNEYDGRQGAS